MARVALLDVNVLVALFDPDHVHHDLAHDWFVDHRPDGWATCAMTESGVVRVICNPKYRPDPPRPAVAVDQLRMLCASGHHHYWGIAPSLRDAAVFALGAARGHGQITDVCLLGLAKTMKGTLATFDSTIPIGAVQGATSDHLSVITAA
jgi:toxin-antitoxin system PIN domain toxin